MKDPVVYQPKTKETLSQYLQRYTADETIDIFQHPVKLNEFCTILLQTPWEAKLTEEADFPYQKLWSILEETENYNVLLHHIKIWEPSRKELLKKLSEYASELNKVSKWCTVGRIVGCSTESLSTIVGLQFTESKAESWLVRMATLFGGLSIFITLAEMRISKDAFNNLMEFIKRDQKLFAPIKKWYQQSEKVEKAMSNVFPFDFTSKIVKEFSDVVAGKKEFDRVNLLTSLFAGLLEKNKKKEKHKEDEENEESEENVENPEENSKNCEENQKNHIIMQQLVDFMSHPACKELCELLHSGYYLQIFIQYRSRMIYEPKAYNIFFRETHPVLIDIARMMLQYYYSPVEFILCQSVRALPSAKQNLFSVPVMGRLILNGYSLLNDVSRLRSCDVPGVHEMRVLEKHMRGELEALNTIIKIFRKKYTVKSRVNEYLD